jgi:NAD(P)-dependent dehydrogenase (short-subunit alcohol dehydrogenase family)
MEEARVKLVDKVAVVTGSASGIGRATALLFAKEGARVVVVDINEHTGQQTVATIREKGGEALFVRADVSKAVDVEGMVSQTVNALGRLDILVNNAGILRMGSVEETSEDDWKAVLGVNLDGVFLCSKAVAPQMRKQGGGVIVNIASGAGLSGVARSAAYCASKGGVVLLTKQMAIDYEKDGIRVNAVCPGAVDTPLMQIMFDEQEDPVAARQEYEAGLPQGRMLDPREVAYQVLFLASHKSYFMTGQCVVI